MAKLAVGDVVMVGERQSDVPLSDLRAWPIGRLGEVVGVDADELASGDLDFAFPYQVNLGPYADLFTTSELVRIGRL
jgi:hypothetical protein